ncbi:hypothetical protein C9I28_17055 [Pseudoduganella armeniaca]|uniref:Uncharacterized protein n=1 Tax=Pseudoduganella armeniaca TaxID=2072590 RepID=A0A2R4CCE0_9BURK|nr:hypothetical protein C9I28_17055 [Pseudoduganella armeniaca]
MSGTILLSSSESLDVRTVDFLRLADALRKHKDASPLVGRLLEHVDVFGINMVCTDELSTGEFAEFAELLRRACPDGAVNCGTFDHFLQQLCDMVRADERMRQGKSA